MSSITAEDVQNVGSEPSQVIADCLGIPLIIRKIFKHFDNDQLLELSCVNKLWNFEARSVMRERGDLMAYLKSSDERLEAFASDLQQMNVVPFAGVHLVLEGGFLGREECQPSTSLLDRTVILDGLPWKQFSFEQNGFWLNKSSQAFLLAKEILREFGGSLEQLSISTLLMRNEAMEELVQECSFPCLKILKVYGCNTDDSYTNFLTTLVSLAPNLQEFHSRGPLSLLATVLEGSSARLMYPLETSLNEVPESIIGALRLEEMNLAYPREDFSLERFNWIAPQLLQMSCNTLRSMKIDAVLAVPLMCYGICLRNVTQLSMTIDFQQLQLVQPSILRLVQSFDFTRIFLSVSEVSVRCLENEYELAQDDMNALLEQANLVLKEPSPDRAAKIKHLSAALADSAVPFFAEMFPDIEKLTVWAHRNDIAKTPVIPFGLIWTHFTGLTELEFFYHLGRESPHIVGGLDSDFCGIFPEEVAELREKDEEYLKAVNIVPVMPAVTLLKNLRAFKVRYMMGVLGPENPIQFIFSKVTAFLGFERCPKLVSCLIET